MSKFICLFCSIIVILGCVGYNLLNTNNNIDTYFRIHIIGDNSETNEDKIIEDIRDSLVNYLTPKLQSCKDVDDALLLTIKELNELKIMVQNIVNSYNDNCNISLNITNEFFPDRIYGNYYVSSGYYDALTISLGKANGDNWWCVLYPPLCNESSENKVVYTSKLWDIINQ